VSYILEALKKSERERQRGNITTLQTSSQIVLSQRSLWIGFVVGVAALGAVAATAWFVRLQLTGSPVVSPAASPEPSRQESPAPTAPQQSQTSSAVVDSGTAVPAQPADTVQRVESINQLDAPSRARVAGLSLNVVSYSKVPAHRFIMVNQRIVHESETIGDGIVVKRILPNGALLDVGKYEIMLRPD
jgi:general secretion pathway protein B